MGETKSTSQRDAAAVSVTPEMLAAGLSVFYESGVVDVPLTADRILVREIYRAMAAHAVPPVVKVSRNLTE